MTVEIVVALTSASVAILAAYLSARAARTTARIQYDLEREKSRASKEELVEELMSRYREPLVRSAIDLQSRIFNIVKQDFLLRYATKGTDTEREYAVMNTLYVFAEYLGWVEVLRADVQFMDLGDVGRNQQLTLKLEGIADAFAVDDRTIRDPTFRIFRGEQRALGEIMSHSWPGHDGERRGRCIGYAQFVTRLNESPEFARWFTSLVKDIECLGRSKPQSYERLAMLQHALVDLIQFLDDPPFRFDPATWTKL